MTVILTYWKGEGENESFLSYPLLYNKKTDSMLHENLMI